MAAKKKKRGRRLGSTPHSKCFSEVEKSSVYDASMKRVAKALSNAVKNPTKTNVSRYRAASRKHDNMREKLVLNCVYRSRG